ncbi:E3 ubiquitin-protein ligase MYCBP2 [Leptidea sinapis]|uniref:E3 ubiquitin-protein ligase MYCBP2 n=1 Tax=Leptidea sinapis TaxID=189913 RepID=UPI0021C2A9C0|nr:E3 ubiquitin-protein ligase MYCBP2 [Leptidea sinapis]
MSLKNQMAEVQCMEPENYRKFFRFLCWSGNRISDKTSNRRVSKKDKTRTIKLLNTFGTSCFAPALLSNPSQFAVYATVRKSIISRWRYIHGSVCDLSEDSDNDDQIVVPGKLPKITGIGLRTVFSLIRLSRNNDTGLCESALRALLDVLQDHQPGDLRSENDEVISTLHDVLVDVSKGIGGKTATSLTSLSTSCLIALSVARGDTEIILNTVSCLIMVSQKLSDEYLQVPVNLTVLQKSVQQEVLGAPSRYFWLDYGVPHQCLVNSFPVDLPPQLLSGSQELVIRSFVSDGSYLFIFTSKGLVKIGSGYGNTIRQHVYLYKPDFYASDRHGWIGIWKDNLYVRIGRKKTDIYEIDKNTFQVKSIIHLNTGTPIPTESKSAVFTDGNNLGLVTLTKFDNLNIRFYDLETTACKRLDGQTHDLEPQKELNVILMRRTTLVLGTAPYEDVGSRRILDLDVPVAVQLDDSEDDPLTAINAGQDFGLLTTASGKVYYTGKPSSLGYKVAATYTSRWTLMKETVFTRHEYPKVRKTRVIQVAVGHEGVHAILVLDNGTAMFTGIARRGEDGDGNKRRSPKPSRPKKIAKAENFYVVYAACNYGSTALLTRQGLVLMFGKDTQHCDAAGIVTGLKHERIVQMALGKAHAIALTNLGQVYSFGINNKGQCGREFGYTKEKGTPTRKVSAKEELVICTEPHSWSPGPCRICTNCRECTGYAGACRNAAQPNRLPGEICGCSDGDSGCSVCGICRRCAEIASSSKLERVLDSEDEPSVYEIPATSEQNTDEGVKCVPCEPSTSKDDMEKDTPFKGSSLAPARIPLPGGQKIEAIACGLHHTVLLTHTGEVLTFGSNQFGALGAGDISAHHRIIRVRVPRASAIAAGSNHTAVITKEGEVYTFGNYHKGGLGRPRTEEPREERSPIWYATPGRVPRLGPKYNYKAVSVSASGDQTFVQVSQALLKTDTLFSATITANENTIIILPNCPEHTFKCVTIYKLDGSCYSFSGPEQVDFVNTLACLDPLYDVLWCYQPQMKVIKVYNIQAFDSHKLQRCSKNDPEGFINDMEYEYPQYGIMRKFDDFRDVENIKWVSSNEDRPADGVAIANVSILNQDLAIPSVKFSSVTRLHAALNLIGTLDSLLYAHDNRSSQVECKLDGLTMPSSSEREDFKTVNRFDSQGGGWGYTDNSVEAIRFMCDTDILLGGYALYGGRGDYTAKLKLFDLGPEGGDQECEGELIAETGVIHYECAPREKYPILFPTPIALAAQRWFVALVSIRGPSSDCGSSGRVSVTIEDITFNFKATKKSNNGTDVNAGQIPCLLYNVINPVRIPKRRRYPGDDIIALSKSIYKHVTVSSLKSLITLLQWTWNTYNETLLDTNGQVTINYSKLAAMKHQKRLVYVIRACLRLLKSYISDLYPENILKRNSQETIALVETIAVARNLIQVIMSNQIPTCAMLSKKFGRNKSHRVCYVQFALEMTNSILKEAHETVTVCFHAFYPTPMLKWHHLCSLLCNVSDGIVPGSQVRELMATCAAMCGYKSLFSVLQDIVPLTQSCFMSNELKKLKRNYKHVKDHATSKSATIPRSSHSNPTKPPPIPPRANKDIRALPPSTSRSNYTDWHLLDIIPILQDIVMIPIKDKMMTRQCGQPHDHGEILQNEKLGDYCCKFLVRLVAELAYNSRNITDDNDTEYIKHLITPSRFIRVNRNPTWSTSTINKDIICFTVDREGVMLAGACVYGGTANINFTLELVRDVTGTAEPDFVGDNWACVRLTTGTFSAEDCQQDMVQIKFEKAALLRDDTKYALRLSTKGGLTVFGDNGLASVKGPDGTTFHFSSNTISCNGTNVSRGQLPCIIYYGSTKPGNSPENPDAALARMRAITTRVASMVIERGAELFRVLRNELTTEDLRRNSAVLQQSSVVTTLLPFVLSHLEDLEDSKSVVKILETIHKLLPHVAAMNLLVPSGEETSTVTTTQYYTWIESPHPYKQASVSNMRLMFPPQVSWIVLEIDPRSITAQPEDSLTIYAVAGSPRHQCHCSTDYRIGDPPFRKVYQKIIQLTSDTGDEEEIEDSCVDAPCLQYNCTYVSVTPKLSNVSTDWPRKPLLVPGDEVIFSLETASDYLSEYKSEDDESRYGFRCLCAGYEDAPFTTNHQGLLSLEMELVYAGAACATKLIMPSIDIPQLSYLTVIEVQNDSAGRQSETEFRDKIEEGFLDRGIDLSSPPTVHAIADGQPFFKSSTTERQFLMDFVASAEGTAGGRLACWLAPSSRVDPENCELRASATVVLLSSKITLPVILRDQYGDVVTSKAVKIEVVAQSLRMPTNPNRPQTEAERESGIPNVRFLAVKKDSMCFQTITVMKEYQQFSLEELRLASGIWGEGRGYGMGSRKAPTERFTVHRQADGSYSASWTARLSGKYLFKCFIDGQPTPQEIIIEVPESENIDDANGAAQPKMKQFLPNDSAGLRVRASPSLQAEQIGRVPPGAYVCCVEEILNKDGSWVRLGSISLEAFVEGNVEIAWCIQYHRQLDKTLLGVMDGDASMAPEEDTSEDYLADWNSDAEPTGQASNDAVEEIPVLFSVRYDLADHEDEENKSPAREPSKIDRQLRKDAAASGVIPPGSPRDSPLRAARRNNGNGEVEDEDPLQKEQAADNAKEAVQKPVDGGNEANDVIQVDGREALYDSMVDENNEQLVKSSEEIELEASNVKSEDAADEEVAAANLGNALPGDEEKSVANFNDAVEKVKEQPRLAQAATQTSPDIREPHLPEQLIEQPDQPAPSTSKEETIASVRQRVENMSNTPVRTTPLVRKQALSFSQAECLRSIFAAMLWHEGIVPDAIACAAFLKFHPQLPKAGAQVVTRGSHDTSAPKPQRHSVEVTNAGQYLNINPSTLETLTRSGIEASSSRSRTGGINTSIKEEDTHTQTADSASAAESSCVVNVLPPALRALVALWDSMCDSDALNAATEKIKKEDNEEDEIRPLGGTLRKKPWKFGSNIKLPYAVRCELCGGSSVTPPLAAHMRSVHPGCRKPTSRGYDRAGMYNHAEAIPSASDTPSSLCGQLAQDLIGVKIRATLAAYQLWYLFCEKCRERALKASSGSPKKIVTIAEPAEPAENTPIEIDHIVMRDNASFLLDLLPLNASEASSSSRGPLTPTASIWQPAPHFQCLEALGAKPKQNAPDSARYHSLGRPMPGPSTNNALVPSEMSNSQQPRVHRSVSLGQADERNLASAARPPLADIEPAPQEKFSGAGSSLLSQPSAALQKLVGCEFSTGGVSAFETPQVDLDALVRKPVMAFVLAKRDLQSYRRKLDAVVRINTVRQYAFEALNWLLRSTTQPTSVHDVLWWFCNAIDSYAAIAHPSTNDDNKENLVNDPARLLSGSAATWALCPGGRIARGARAAMHGFLGSVSALAPSLSPASAVNLQAIRCWDLSYSEHDRTFLHRSQVFSVVSKVLSHSPDGMFEDSLFGAMLDNYESMYNEENYLWSCPDVTGWCAISVSSRQGMAGALTDNSTETFWESGEEDKNRARWIQICYNGGSYEDRPHIICIHIDNSRDPTARIHMVSFWYSGGPTELLQMMEMNVELRNAQWICYTLPISTGTSVRVRCELHGPDPAVRVRQVRVLSMPQSQPAAPQLSPLHAITEKDTLRVFRLLTTQVFGKLLDWEQTGNETEGAVAEETTENDSDLCEHVVGILFAGNNLTTLQKKVMSHIVWAIGCETSRVRDDWETALMCAESNDGVMEPLPKFNNHQDNYCFEMLSLLLALSGSPAGLAHLVQRSELLKDLLALLHTGSERVQRQVISLVRRIITVVPPDKMLVAINKGNNRLGPDFRNAITLLDHLVGYMAKAVHVIVKVKGAVGPSTSTPSVTLGNSVDPMLSAPWFMRSETTMHHALLVASLITDMAQGVISADWAFTTRVALTDYIKAIADVEEANRSPKICITKPAIWLALASLCVSDTSILNDVNNHGRDSQSRDSLTETKPLCANHDDGTTAAVIECHTCGTLCGECDRFLHLNRTTRTHQRQVCKEEESAIRAGIHESCARVKLFWLLLLIDRRTLKGLIEFRGMDTGIREEEDATTSSGVAGVCRFCGTKGNSGLLAIGNICADQQCQEHGREACSRTLGCGHFCGGVRGERTCLPCLFGCTHSSSLRQDADDMCMICFTDPLQAAPAIQLTCGHVFHLHCCRKVLLNKWNGPRISFSFAKCPICKEDISHWTLEELVAPVRQLYEEVHRKALMRLEYEGMSSGAASANFDNDPALYAMERYAYYVCHKCGKAYFGGLARCEADSNSAWDPKELVCGACSDVAGAKICPKHGSDFLEYKCRYCCSVAVFFCFGTSHFCNPCHDDFQRITNIPRHTLPQCPTGPRCEQLIGTAEECPLHVQHPPTGEEFALGCGVCRNAQSF